MAQQLLLFGVLNDMDLNAKATTSRPILFWYWRILFAAIIVSLLVAIALPNFIGGGPTRLTSTVNMLRQIDGAKQLWAQEHGFTNSASQLKQISQEDIAPCLTFGERKSHIDKFGFGFDENGYIHVGKGVTYSINPLGTSPSVLFTSDYRDRTWPRGWRIPKGTVMVLSGGAEGYILPGHESEAPKSLGAVFANN